MAGKKVHRERRDLLRSDRGGKEGRRLDGRDEAGLKDPEFERLGGFYFSRGILHGCPQTLLNHGIVHPRSQDRLVAPWWGKT